MKIEKNMTDERLLRVIGERLSRARIERELTQKELADEAGLGVRTIQRLEKGEAAIQLNGFLRVLRVLGLVDRLEALLPEDKMTPMEELRFEGKRRQRVRSKQTTVSEDQGPWKWGDEE